MIFTLLIILCIVSAIATLITFFLYIKARMAGRMEEQERRYLTLHFITLCLFILFGVLILIHLSDSINSGASYTLLANKLLDFFV